MSATVTFKLPNLRQNSLVICLTHKNVIRYKSIFKFFSPHPPIVLNMKLLFSDP